jgi:hypothetical protein
VKLFALGTIAKRGDFVRSLLFQRSGPGAVCRSDVF